MIGSVRNRIPARKGESTNDLIIACIKFSVKKILQVSPHPSIRLKLYIFESFLTFRTTVQYDTAAQRRSALVSKVQGLPIRSFCLPSFSGNPSQKSGFRRHTTKSAIDTFGWRRMVVAALNSRARCGQ